MVRINMPKKLERQTLREQAEEAMMEMIHSYRFTPGKWINAERLAKDLGVSRTPIWQALKKLEKEGLVTHVPKRGMRMTQMTLKMAHDLYLVRGLLEGLAVRLAAKAVTRKNISRMEAILAKQSEIVKRLDVVEYSKTDFLFHGLIYDACGNWLLHELLENIKARSRPFVCDITPILGELLEDHVQIVEALKRHDGDQAEKAMLRHNQRMSRQIEKAQGKP